MTFPIFCGVKSLFLPSSKLRSYKFGTRSSIATFPSWFPIAGGRVPHQDQQVDSNEPHGHLTADGVQFFKSSFPTWKIVGACDCTRVGQLRISPEKAPLRDFSCGLKWLFRWKSCKSKENGEMTELDLKFQWASQIRSQIWGILKPITQWQTKEGITWINPINPAAQFCTLCQFFQDFFPASVLSLCRISSSLVWRFCQNTSDGSDRTTSTCPGIGNVKGNVKGVCKGD